MLAQDPDSVEKLTQGRRWKPVLWTQFVPGPAGHHLTDGLGGGEMGQLALDPGYEYRLLYDPDRELWRVDARRHVAGG